jgi:hypothetical protein
MNQPVNLLPEFPDSQFLLSKGDQLVRSCKKMGKLFKNFANPYTNIHFGKKWQSVSLPGALHFTVLIYFMNGRLQHAWKGFCSSLQRIGSSFLLYSTPLSSTNTQYLPYQEL